MKRLKFELFILMLTLATAALGQVESLSARKCIQTPDVFNGQVVYSTADKMPEYYGGLSAFSKYVLQHLNSSTAVETPKFKIYTTFIIDTLGYVQDVCTITTNTPKKIENDLVKIIQNSAAWTPARKNNKPVCIRMTIPLTICLK